MRGDGRVDDKAGYLKQCGQSVRGTGEETNREEAALSRCPRGERQAEFHASTQDEA